VNNGQQTRANLALVTPGLLSRIESEIDLITHEYQKAQGLILTEADLKCLLYQRLLTIPELQGYARTRDPHIKATRIHCEVTWYDSDDKLSIRPDITILEPQNLSVLRGFGAQVNLPRKGFYFKGSAVVFELKFNRYKSGITRSYHEKIVKDWEKIRSLFRRLRETGISRDRYYCFFVIFSKTDRVCPEFMAFAGANAESPVHKILYRTGRVLWDWTGSI
jgi:hypothetical protein